MTKQAPVGPPYSVFTVKQKRWIIFIGAASGWFSGASSFIYFPAIPFLASDLGVSVERINLTVTSYLVASGVFPTLLGNAADEYGRRPVFIAALGIYAAINVGLALQRSFAALITLRMFQSAAISGTFSIAFGAMGDVTIPADRGGYLGFMSIFINTGQSVAPMISGLLMARWKWDAIFWFLAVASSVVLSLVLLLLPETCRRIVGNGSIRPPRWINRVLLPFLRPATTEQQQLLTPPTPSSPAPDPSSPPDPDSRPAAPESPPPPPKAKRSRPNPFSGLAMLRNKGTAVVVVTYGFNYALYSCLQASLSTIFVDIYGVSGLVAGLSYIPFGVACIIASYLAGRLLDRDYRRTAATTVGGARTGEDIVAFPIEHARLRTTKWIVACCAPLVVAYGWALQARVVIRKQALNALLVDFHPDRPSAIQATNNLFRCELAAGALALLDIMLRALGPGWCFVILGVLHSLSVAPLWLLEIYGLGWRTAKQAEQDEKAEGIESPESSGSSSDSEPDVALGSKVLVGSRSRQ
ncbi:major facilitator superfamily domain-containing protein [Lasiosphaeria miniovina]|uniref:Major facilitator superfamily domain-containing protein n=1 Tax=Lasiosphaeria miniovina TaxID=1954250 RepID=A0AA40E3K3_9PEZI|nr:major facilitator superfamily domain-containing protein [Lasiosphaeria miniovina]KAK0726769.1 major facilitator superfamily domain-containing protein [Lasiosphaeria miniovina]